MNEDHSGLPPEIQAAYREGKARGVPDGWTVTIDKRNRRKWTAPSGRSCDSIPKALAISVELGLLPPDTYIPTGRKRKTPQQQGRNKKAKKEKKQRQVDEEDDIDDEEEEEDDTPPEPMDPETTLDGHRRATMPTTVHWDPHSPDGNKIGWKVKVALPDSHDLDWIEGRVVRYDPYTHKHKIVLERTSDARSARSDSFWIWIRNDEHNLQIATRLVWAHVKGYAWWPALVNEANADRKEGYVSLEFFGTGEVSNLRETPETVRPFDPELVDPIVAKHKKKRNAAASDAASRELQRIQEIRNEAALFYATRAIGMANRYGNYIGKRVQLFRSDVNYPYGDTVVARVRQYSSCQKKWLLSFEYSDKTRTKYSAAWINLQNNECALKVLEKKKSGLEDEDLVPYIVGYEPTTADDELRGLLHDRCRGCVEFWKKDEHRITCSECKAAFHLSCFDPPLSLETWQRLVNEGVPIVCPRCTVCRGCYQKDITFGSHLHPPPATLSFPSGEPLNLCLMCKDAYDDERFCPNCAHSWDDKKFTKVRKQIDWLEKTKKKRSTDLVQDTQVPQFGEFTGDDVLPVGAKVDPAWFNPETSEWGFTEVEMLVCDSCKIWVHAGCAGISEEEYDEISDGDHPIFSKEFLCRVCCRNRCRKLISSMREEDLTGLFAAPVSEKVAPNYHDVIKNPMDLQTMLEKAENEEYQNYAWMRELFELMVLNALTFNRFHTKVWTEAHRFYMAVKKKIFGSFGKGAPPSKYEKAINANIAEAGKARALEADRIRVDETVEKKDLVAGSMAANVTLPRLRDATPDQESCVPFVESYIQPTDSLFCCWMDSCFTCGSSGAADTMLFCVDCGEAFHSFCVGSPVHSMGIHAAVGWRCPNCKICEISGEVPRDETRMIFCEMCDRAYCLDLLDPPLQEAPSGLWICGQCVDCNQCRGKFDPDGPNLRQWSCDPEKCYRCGGISGALEQLNAEIDKCGVCSLVLRTEEESVATCSKCNTVVHSQCDPNAEKHCRSLLEDAEPSRRRSGSSYHCADCAESSKSGQSPGIDAVVERAYFEQAAWVLSAEEDLGEDMSRQEYFWKLLDSCDWRVREMWREEYISVVREGIRLAELAKTAYGDPRIVTQHVFSLQIDLPDWIGQRALRFILVAKRTKWEKDGMKADRIEKVVVLAKLAAAFVKVACHSMGIEFHTRNATYKRIASLLDAPDDTATCELPRDDVRSGIDEDVLSACGIAASSQVVEDVAQTSEAQEVLVNLTTNEEPVGIIPKALCGWGQTQAFPSKTTWKDPRECCLCHLCGDDDAGFHNAHDTANESIEPRLARLGRLLPMPDGNWVHTLCALWSSEVWESADDGKIHAVDKARARGAQLKCFGCGRHGATVGCNKGNCNFNYHFPCAKYCGSLFADNKHVYCAAHRASATSELSNESFEYMKALFIAPEKKASSEKDGSEMIESSCSRVGSIVVHSLGEIDSKSDSFHSDNYIMPPGYMVTRIFWSFVAPRTRTVYMLKIERMVGDTAEFVIIPGDAPAQTIRGSSATSVYNTLMDKVLEINAEFFSFGDMHSKLPTVRRNRRKAFGLNGPQFFGFGLDHIRRQLETLPGVEAVVAPLTKKSPRYRFCFTQPTIESIKDLQRKRAAVKAEQDLENLSGCARTEGIKAVARSGGSGRITRALVRSAEEIDATASSTMTKKEEEKAKADRNLNQIKYRRMKAIPMEQRLVARRSHIHGWGLFSKLEVPKDDPIIEYMGEIIRQPVADIREKAYEVSGEGSCYMFRLDWHRIVDATMIGCMARFMNHSCQPNVEAKVITIDTDSGPDKKIVVFAKRDISAGEEITYDYKFPVEDGSLRCTCGAPNCIGRLN